MVTNKQKVSSQQSPPSSPTSSLQNISILNTGYNCNQNPNSQNFGRRSDLEQFYSTEDLFVFPTVQDRVEQLAMQIPPNHSLTTSVFALRDSLQLDLAERVENSAGGGTRTPNQVLIALLRDIVLPLRLHAQVLFQALVKPRSEASDNTVNENNNNNNNDISGNEFPLHEYVGDILIVTYLLNSDSSHNCFSVEGSLTQFTVVQGAPDTYATWVLLCCGILRTKFLSEHERIVLGVPDFGSMYHFDFTDPTVSHLAYSYHQSTCGWSVPMERFHTDPFAMSELSLVYDDFGPLGPSFRGRDVVRIQQVSAQCLLACYMSPSRGIASRVAFDWMCLAHEQASKTRPMTVRTPMIRFT